MSQHSKTYKKSFKRKLSFSQKRRVFRRVRQKKAFKKLNQIALIFLLSIFFFGSMGIMSGLAYLQLRVAAIPKPDEVFSEVTYASEIYDRNGQLLYRLHGDDSNRDEAKPAEITNVVRAVFMAAEDAEFFNHTGVRSEAITRCALNNLTDQKKCGASTITQQVVKIKTKRNQPTFERKVDEVLTATKVEEQYTKDEILMTYFNITPYGSNITGIKTAAKFYFGVENLTNLTMGQAIILAGIINDPIKLSPTLSDDQKSALEGLEERKSYILGQLTEKLQTINQQLEANYPENFTPITAEQIQNAEQEKIVYQPPNSSDMKAGHFVNYVMNKLQADGYFNGTPFTLDELKNGGYKIYTSLDYNLQQIAERYAGHAGSVYQNWNVYNAAVMTTRPSTGEIITMAGSKSFYAKSEGCDAEGKNCKFDPQVNVLTSLQSPGSTNKPLGYYLAYKNSILAPNSFLPDIPIQIGDYTPKNWDSQFLGTYHTAREMLRQSRNIPALITLDAVGVQNYLNAAREFGYTTYKDDSQYGHSVILGGADVYPIEHVQAYGVFANGGNLVKLNPILKILDNEGNVVYQSKVEPNQIADPAAVFLLNQSLMGLDTGTGVSIAWDDREIAGKTGTTENNKDSLLVMYSPDFVTLGWVGNNNNDLLDFNYGWPAFVVAPWLKDYMIEISNTPFVAAKTKFHHPDNVYYGGGDCNYQGCLGLEPGWLISGREPSRSNIQLYQRNGQWYRIYKMPSPNLQPFLDKYWWR